MCPARARTAVWPRALRFLLSFALLTSALIPPSSRASAPSAEPRAAAPAQAGAAPAREGELLVRFRADVTERGRDEVASSKGARRKGALRGGSRLERLALQPGQDAAAAAAQLRGRAEVELVEPNFIISRAQVTPDDPRFAEQWALRNEGRAEGGRGSDVRALPAWQAATGSAATLIAVLDSGVDFTHPDLRANEWNNPREQENGRDDDRDGYVDDLHGWDFVADGAAVTDVSGHGTAVAGIIAAEGNNGVGTSGVMWRAGLMSLRVLDSNGAGDVAAAVEAIDYAVAHGAQVINCSWGTGAPSESLREALARAGAAGVVVVASAGNAGRDVDAAPYYPASYGLSNVISVAATDAADRLASWSNWGAAGVKVAAPGVGVLTTAKGGGYEAVTGTSAAAPVVAGIAGLIKSLRPSLKAERTREAVVQTARAVPGLAGKVEAGGVADAAAALALIASWPAGADFDTPSGDPKDEGADGGKGKGAGGNGGSAEPGPPPRPGRPRQSLPNLDEMRRKLASDPIPRPAPARSKLPDYVRGEPTQVPGETISADWV
ncbi:MAG TPA: S8 family peptidase, partial [Pyrinomonadaceae bacterium]